MAGTHVVAQGEHLSAIAHQYGFPDYRRIWNDPQNAELKSLRQDPNVLFPGDRIVIPQKDSRQENRPTDQRHQFLVRKRPLQLRVKLERTFNTPVANASCRLRVEADVYELTTNADGQLEHDISATAVEAQLQVQTTITYKGRNVPVQIDIPIKIGYLDPVEERSGQAARLANLGYYRLAADRFDEDEFLSAVEEFQLEHELHVDGECGPQTQAKLKKVHGC